MLDQNDQLYPKLLRPFQLGLESFVVVADVVAQFMQVLFAVDAQAALLGREPDVDGEQGWLVRLYTDMSRVAVVDGILGSAEFSGVAAAMGF